MDKFIGALLAIAFGVFVVVQLVLLIVRFLGVSFAALNSYLGHPVISVVVLTLCSAIIGLVVGIVRNRSLRVNSDYAFVKLLFVRVRPEHVALLVLLVLLGLIISISVGGMAGQYRWPAR